MTIEKRIGETDYDKLAELESKHWENIGYDGRNIYKDQQVLLQWESHPIVKSYSKFSQTGDSSRDWLNFLIEHFKKFRHGCSIGCGTGWVEKILVGNDLVELMDCFDISEGAIEEAKKTNQYPNRLNFTACDCNRIQLDPNKYDFIIFHHSFHHLLELEHIMNVVEKALSPDGIVVIVDYVGETRGQWEDIKINLCKFVLDFMPEGIHRQVTYLDEEFFRENPFEMVRSAEIVPLMNSRFRLLWQRNIAGVLYPLNNMIVSAIPERKYDRFIVLACFVDALAAGIIKPGFTFSIYTKKHSVVTLHATDVSTERILEFLNGLGHNTQKKQIYPQDKVEELPVNSQNVFVKAVRYLKKHGMRTTAARSLLELSRLLDRDVPNVPYTGERVVPAYKNDCFYAHLSIYNFAREFVQYKIVLDAGCGSGYGTHYLATHGAKTVQGIDIGEDAIAFAKGNYISQNLTYMQMDCEKIHLNKKSFDVVFSSNMIEHLDNYHAFLKGVRDVLKDDGIFILATPPLYGSEPVEDNPYHQVSDWIDILSGYYKHIETYRHVFKADKRNKQGSVYILDFANKPEDCTIDETDFYFEKVPTPVYRNRLATLTALFILKDKK